MVPPVTLLLSIALIGTGMAVITYQDFLRREVNDLVLTFPALGFILLYISDPRVAILAAVMLAILAGICLVMYELGMVAQGDVMTIPLISTLIYAIPYISIAIAVVAASHMVYVGLANGWRLKRRVAIERARKDYSWIPDSIDGRKLEGPPEAAYDAVAKCMNPQAMVEESYGLPLAGYVAVGSIIGIALWLIL